MKEMKTDYLQVTLMTLVLIIVGCDDSGPRSGEPRLKMTFIDVGQGDATLLELPGGETILIDGGDEGFGKSAVLPVLEQVDIEEIDLVVLSHPHADHCGGLDEVIAEFPVHQIWENGETGFSRAYFDFVGTYQSEEVPVMIPPQGYTRRFGEVTLTVLNREEGYSAMNNDSLVVMVSYGHIHILFTGDIEAEESRDLVLDYGTSLRADLVKVPHHGSGNCDLTFVETVHPKFAVVSVGLDNSYGHPSEWILAAYRNRGAKVCLTSLAGDVTASTDGEELVFDCAGSWVD
jgi:competence protein ComEC